MIDDQLISQNKNGIEQLVFNFEYIYNSTIDYDLFDENLEIILACSKNDGIEENIIW